MDYIEYGKEDLIPTTHYNVNKKSQGKRGVEDLI